MISGPNAGGKTVAAKAVGLAALGARAGLHVPCAPGSALPLFDTVCAEHRRRAGPAGGALHVLGAHGEPGGDRGAGRPAHARDRRRDRRGHRAGRGRGARPGDPRGAGRTGRARARHHALQPAEGDRRHRPALRERERRVRPGDAAAHLPDPPRPARLERRHVGGAAHGARRADRRARARAHGPRGLAARSADPRLVRAAPGARGRAAAGAAHARGERGGARRLRDAPGSPARRARAGARGDEGGPRVGVHARARGDRPRRPRRCSAGAR